MVTGKQLKAAILARRAAQGPRKKRTRPEPRQYTVADLERARDRVAAAERRIDNDRSSNPNRGRAGLERAQLELAEPAKRFPASGSRTRLHAFVIEAQLRLRGLLRDDDDDEGKLVPVIKLMMTHRRFATAAEAIHYAVEELRTGRSLSAWTCRSVMSG